MLEPAYRIGIDLGGTKIELAAFDAHDHECLRKRVPTPRQDYRATIKTLRDLVLEAEGTLGQRATVGIGTPGSLSPVSGLVRNANSTCLNGQPFKQDVEAVLEREVRLANDANCFTVSEARDGAGAGADVVFGVILGTGVGGGLAVHGRLLAGANAIAGEWGHNPLPSIGPEDLPLPICYCGRSGCVETYLSGPGLSRDHFAATGNSLSAEAIARSAESGDPQCAGSLERYEARLARSLAILVNVLDPDVIVLGGGLSHIQRLYGTVPRLWLPHIFSDTVRTRLLPNRHGDSSGVRGAAWLWG
ncbi:MAG: ROK family protein [Acidobacteriota bacterium]|nr:ROK family protein [Acidobacteriota bacterium]